LLFRRRTFFMGSYCGSDATGSFVISRDCQFGFAVTEYRDVARSGTGGGVGVGGMGGLVAVLLVSRSEGVARL